VISPRHAILVSLGTDGDIIPYLAVGRELHRRGHGVTLLANENFREEAQHLGFDFHSFVSNEDYDRFLADKLMWHPLKSGSSIAKWGERLLHGQYNLLRKVAQGEGTVIVGNAGALAARLVHEQFGIPLANLVLQPWIFQSTIEPPIMAPGLSLPRFLPKPIKWIYWFGFNRLGDQLAAGELNRIRKENALPPVRNVLRWWFSPQRVIAMFPEWYGPKIADWPKVVVNAGFPGLDSAGVIPMETMKFIGAGSAPILFTFGTGMRHARAHFGRAVELCANLGMRGIFLSKFAEQLPLPLPDVVHHCPSAPFSELFPKCALIVHHGGIGTTAKALKSGTPQLLLPFAYDQFDNGHRVARMGAGDWLRQRDVQSEKFEASVDRCLSEAVKTKCRQIRDHYPHADGAVAAADILERDWETQEKSAPKRACK
jgi:rhamnosyltransferase subunit B